MQRPTVCGDMAGPNKEVEARKRAEVAAYVRQLYERGNYTSQAEMANDVGVTASSVSPWLSEQPKPGRGIGPHNLMKLIQAVERRKEGASAVPIDRPLETRLQALEEIVESQGQAMTRALSGLAKEVRAIRKPPDAQDAGATGAGG